MTLSDSLHNAALVSGMFDAVAAATAVTGSGTPASISVTGGGLARSPIAFSVLAVDQPLADGVRDVFSVTDKVGFCLTAPVRKNKNEKLVTSERAKPFLTSERSRIAEIPNAPAWLTPRKASCWRKSRALLLVIQINAVAFKAKGSESNFIL